MITVCSSKENIEAVWVKNEWSRFLSFAAKNSSRTLIPLYFDMDKADLPDDFLHLPAYDIKADGFEQDLIRGIKKLIPLPVMLLEKRKKRNKILKKIGIGALACAVAGIIVAIPWFKKLPEYNAAMQLYYDKNYPKATWAFAELGSYRDAEEMKEKCELSWRKKVSTVITEGGVSTDWSLRGGTGGSYYISDYGTVEYFEHNPGKDYKDIDIANHGKVISIGNNIEGLYILFEDGYLDSTLVENDLFASDIVKTSSIINNSYVVLKSDGTMDIETTDTAYSAFTENDEWLNDIKSWTNIVDFDYYLYDENGYFWEGIVIGQKADGTLCHVHSEFKTNSEKSFENILNLADTYKNVKEFAVYEDNIIVLKTDNVIEGFINGENLNMFAENVIDVEIANNEWQKAIGFVLNKQREMKLLDNTLILNDVIHISDCNVITGSGDIYRIQRYADELLLDETNETSVIYEEWTERFEKE